MEPESRMREEEGFVSGCRDCPIQAVNEETCAICVRNGGDLLRKPNKQLNVWHYTAAGELPPKQEENHPMSSKCIVAIKGIISGKTYIDIARYDFSGKAWFSFPEGRVNVYAWKVEEPPEEMQA